MRYVKASPLEVGFRMGSLRPPTPSLSIAVKGTFDPAAGDPAPFADEQAPVCGDEHLQGDVERPLRYPTDLALMKPHGECMLVGCAAAQTPVPALRCRFVVGEIDRTFVVFGDRGWRAGRGGLPSEPQPFSSMDLSMERAFGGPGYAKNPYGIGEGRDQLPNLEHPAELIVDRQQRPEPVVVGPLPIDWPARMRWAGTYDARYERQRWPWLPADLDPRFFMSAPPEQQLAQGYFRGDERLLFEGLHPQLDRVQSRLPHIAPRVFLDAAGAFTEVTMRLDTVTWDAEVGRLYCVWRGLAEPPTLHMDDIDHLLVGHEDLPPALADGAADAQPTSVETWRETMRALLAAEAAEELDAEGEAPPDGPPAASEPADRTPPDRTDRTDGSADGSADSAAANPATEVDAHLAGLIERGASLSSMDLSGVDLAGYALEGVDLRGAILKGARLRRCQLARADLSLAVLAEADLTGADLTGADLRAADLAGAQLEGAVLTAAQLQDADFEAARMRGANLEQAAAQGARFVGCDLSEASLGEGDFAEASFDRAELGAANAAGAGFAAAILEEARADGADFSAADLRGLRAEGLLAPRARWVGANASDAYFENAQLQGGDFGHADLTRSDFSRAELSAARCFAASMRRARLDGAACAGMNAASADLMEASLADADLRRADFRGANLFAAQLFGATLAGAELEGANLKRTRLP